MKKISISILALFVLNVGLFGADSAGVSGTVTTLPLDQASLKLEKDWNLIGVNANLTLEEIKNQVGADNLLIITAGNGENYKKILGTHSRFKQFKDKVGYLVKLQKTATLKFTPKTYQDRVIDLTKGWNLINPLRDLSIAEIKQQLGDKLLVISGGDKQYYKSTLGRHNRFVGFKEPYGYWVKVSAESKLKF